MDEFEKWRCFSKEYLPAFGLADSGDITPALEVAFKAGREAGMREASEICKKRADWILTRQDGKPEELSNVILRHHASAHVSAQEEILSAIDK